MTSTTQKPEPEKIKTGTFDSFKYETIDDTKDTVIQSSNDIIEFIPVERKIKKMNEFEIISNDITPEAVSLSSPKFSHKKDHFKILRGSSPSKGFRSFSSVSGKYNTKTNNYTLTTERRLSCINLSGKLLQ